MHGVQCSTELYIEHYGASVGDDVDANSNISNGYSILVFSCILGHGGVVSSQF